MDELNFSLEDFNSKVQQIELEKIMRSGSEQERLEVLHSLLYQNKQLKQISKNSLLDFTQIKEFKVEYPDYPIDIFHDTLVNYLSGLENQEFKIWQNLTVAEIVLELNNKTTVANRFIQDLLDEIFVSENFSFAKAEVFNPEVHSRMTDIALQMRSIYMLVKTLKTQLDRISMGSYVRNGQVVESELIASQDLKALVFALYEKYQGKD